jgi:hypothetical protein
MAYTGPSIVPLPSVYDLLAAGAWAAPPEPRDTTNDVTDEQIAGLL